MVEDQKDPVAAVFRKERRTLKPFGPGIEDLYAERGEILGVARSHGPAMRSGGRCNYRVPNC